MRSLLCCLLILSATLTAAELKRGFDNWNGNPLAWSETERGFKTVSSGGRLNYMPAPLSENCEIEAIVTVSERMGESYCTAGVGIICDDSNFYHLALVEGPLAKDGFHFIELHQMYRGQWPGNDNLEQIYNDKPNENWSYKTPYRLTLKKVKDEITGTVTTLDGTLLFKRTMKFKDDTPVNFVRPSLSTGSFLAEYQDIKADWSGRTLDENKLMQFPPYVGKSFVPGRNDTATGFFHVKQDADGRWWAYDPLGRGFVVFGIDHVSYWGHSCEILGRWLHKEYNDKRFKSKAEWEVETLDRLTGWGFNMLMGGDGALRHRGMAHAIIINVGDGMALLGDEFDITPNLHAPCTAFPNVFHPKFKDWVKYRVNTVCKPQASNPWLFGYFIDNELCWWGRGSNYGGLFDATMKKAATHTAKLALRDILMAKANHDIAKFNATWNTGITSFDDILKLESLPSKTDEQKEIKTDYLRTVAELYFGTVHAALRSVDKNHMLLGCRFAGIDGSHPVVWETAGKYSQVLTWNYYGNVDLDAEAAFSTRRFGLENEPLMEDFKRVNEWTGRPCLITEWSFPSIESGLPCTYGAGQRFKTQAERAKATEIFARTMLSMPFLIGYDYFMWVDQPPLGISHAFPENSNYGIINLEGKPYPGLVKLFTDIQHHAAEARMAAIPAPKPTVPPSHELYDRYLAAHELKAGNAVKMELKRTPGKADEFWADNGRFRIYTVPEKPMLNIDFDGKPYAQFGAMTHYDNREGALQWNDVTEILSITPVQEADRLTIVLKARFTPTGENPKEMPFEMTYRLVLLPGSDMMMADVTEIRNIGDEPLTMRGIFLRFFARFDEKPQVATDLDRQLVPRLWKAPKVGGWVSPDQKQYLGFTCGSLDDMILHCWFDEKRGTYHPDLSRYFKDGIMVPAGGKYVPEVPFYVAAFAGNGNLMDMQKRAIEIWK